METIVTAISNVGFPIVCALLCMWHIRNKDKETTEMLNSMRKELDEAISRIEETRKVE